MQVVSRWCRCIVQRLCATDCKRPCLVRAAAPHSAPARTPGVYAQRLCTMQSQQSIHSPSPRGRGLGLGIENLLYFYKNRLFLQTEPPSERQGQRCLYDMLCKLLQQCDLADKGKLLSLSLCGVDDTHNHKYKSEDTAYCA